MKIDQHQKEFDEMKKEYYQTLEKAEFKKTMSMKNLGKNIGGSYQPYKYAFIVFRSMEGADIFLRAYVTAK